MALSDYTLGESKPQSFYDFEPEEYTLGASLNIPPAPEPPSYYNEPYTAPSNTGEHITPEKATDTYGFAPPVYSAPESRTSSGSSGKWPGQWWKNQGIGDWGRSRRGTSGSGDGGTTHQPWVVSRKPPPDVPELMPYEMPERGTAPVFEAPEWDQSEINRLSQEHAAAPIRTLREAYQRTAARLPTNPQSRLLLKDALAGYGSGLESAISGARRTARGEYGQKHGREFQGEAIKYRGALREFEADYATKLTQVQQQAEIENRNKMMKYQADYADYLRGYKQ